MHDRVTGQSSIYSCRMGLLHYIWSYAWQGKTSWKLMTNVFPVALTLRKAESVLDLAVEVGSAYLTYKHSCTAEDSSCGLCFLTLLH